MDLGSNVGYVVAAVKRIPALDGLRGVAILLVVAVHTWRDVLPGGSFGVSLFFVLSGYLITRILTKDETVDFKTFYRNRALRLLPALVVFMAATFIVHGWWSWHPLAYTSNWALIGGTPLPGMWHTWSLAVEEHFYLVWPLVVSLTPRRWLFRVTACLLAVSVGWRLVLVATGADFQRIYQGTDTAAFAILAGCLLAAWNPQVESRRSGWIAVSGIVFAAATVSRSVAYLIAEIAVVGLGVLAIQHAPKVRILEWSVLRWFGKISYGLYLWHTFFFSVPIPRFVALVSGLAVAWLSWHLVEQPLLRLKRSGDPTDPAESELALVARSVGDPQSDEAGSPADFPAGRLVGTPGSLTSG